MTGSGRVPLHARLQPGLVAIVRSSSLVFGLLLVAVVPFVAAAAAAVSLLTLRLAPVGPVERFLIPVVAVLVLAFALLVLLATPVSVRLRGRR